MNSITVYCASSTSIDQEYHDVAKEVGQMIASKGLRLIYGGGRIGLMGEVATAAAHHGGEVIGVITQKFVEHEQANEKCDELIIVNTMQERRSLMMAKGDAFLILPGGVGTYEEFFEVLVGRQIGDHTKPIGLVNVKKYFNPLQSMLEHGINQHFMRPALRNLLLIDPCPTAVIDYLTSGAVSQPPPEEILPMHESRQEPSIEG
ncbi:MAG: TIGR00730 family Rossman fold protein [Planctomycetota bacterium]|nr:TIGR00730 family Rossman fold protein [Planctomycetota bacterium]